MSARKPLLLLVFLVLTTFALPALAQPGRPGQPFQPGPPNQPFNPNGPSDAQKAGAAACSGVAILIAVFAVLLSVGVTALWVFVAIWAANDAKARGMDNGVLWVVLILFMGVIGLVIYLVSRTPGELYVCEDCGKKRLEESRRCPHCRAA